MARVGETPILVRFAAERFHEPNSAHNLLQHARRFAVVARGSGDSRGADAAAAAGAPA